jgi:hypothetical protein
MHEVSWEGLALSKGIYFCRFKALDAIKGDVKFAKTVRVIF